MKKIYKCTGIIAVAIVILFLALYVNNDLGVSKSNIEKDARSSQKINDNWKVAKATTDSMSAMIFYDDNLSDHTFSIYVNRDGFSLGYFFRGGGSTVGTSEGIAEFKIEGYNERAYLSMNKQQISRVKIDNGQTVEFIEIDSTKPFVFILPANAGSVRIYDIDGNVIQSMQELL